jgi:hypothetical protein
MHKPACVALLAVSSLASHAAQAKGLPACSPTTDAGLDVARGEVDQHRLFDVPVVDYLATDWAERNGWGSFELHVDAQGRVTCFVEPAKDASHPLTPQERAVLREASGWRYRPFLKDGRPVALVVSQRYFEQIPPQRHVPTPRVSDDQVRISFVQGRSFFGGFGYSIHVRGDGWVGFHSLGGTDVDGRFGYRVPRPEVAGLIALIRDGDLWSAADDYHGDTTDQSTQWLTVRFGDESRSIKEYAGRRIGMPAIVTRVQEEIVRVARADQWTTLSMEALDRLQHARFDFASQESGKMFARAVLNHRASDDAAMLRLLELGAPIDAPLVAVWATDPPDRGATLIDEALRRRRTRLIAPLIARGALETNGYPDQRKIDAAFRAAIEGGRLDQVKQVWDVAGSRPHPALAYRDTPEYRNVPPKDGVPVALLIGRDSRDLQWEGLEIARWLAAQGNDLKAARSDGSTLLHAAVAGDDPRFVRYLLAQGVDPTEGGRYEYSAVDNAQSEDVALALLGAGSEVPVRSMWFPSYRVRAENKGWSRVVAWLDAHPSAPLMPLLERDREDEARMRRAQERVRTSPCWQRWIADQAKANAAARARGKQADLLPMHCFCKDVDAGAGKTVKESNRSPATPACGAG